MSVAMYLNVVFSIADMMGSARPVKWMREGAGQSAVPPIWP